MRQDTHRPGFVSIAVSIGTLIIIGAVLILLSAAIDSGGWTLIVYLLFVVASVGIGVWLVAFIMRMFERRAEVRERDVKEQNRHVEKMASYGVFPPGYTPIQQAQIAAPKQKEVAPADPRKQLLIDLCLMTIRADGYGPTSKRLMTADDAQEISKARGGKFADRGEWDKASKYAQANYLVYEKRGGKEQGMMVDKQRVGGETIADLIGVLMSNQVLDEAINALPGIER